MNIQGAPDELTVNGKTFPVYPLRDVDHEMLSRWVRKIYLEAVTEATSDPEMRKTAVLEVLKVRWLDYPDLFLRSKGVVKLCNAMARRDVLTEEDVLNDSEAFQKVWNAFTELHRPSQKEDSENPPQAPTQ